MKIRIKNSGYFYEDLCGKGKEVSTEKVQDGVYWDMEAVYFTLNNGSRIH